MPFGIWALMNLPIGSASVQEWLPEGRIERRCYDQFTQSFGHDQFVLLTWEQCNLGDHRLTELKDRLLQEDNRSQRLLAEIETTRDLYEQLTGAPLRLSEAQASERLHGGLLGKDGTAALLIRLTEHGVANQKATMKWILESSDQIKGLGRNELRIAGTAYEAYAVDQAAEESLKWLVLPSSLLGMIVAWVCLRSFRIALAVLMLSAIGQLLAVSMVYYTGHRFSAVLIVLPTLVFMLTLSGAVHLVNYYRDAQSSNGIDLGAKALLVGWLPCGLSTLTTAIGMGSLVTSQLTPVREFGVFSAIGLILATIILLLAFPMAMDWFCRGAAKPIAGHRRSQTASRYTAWVASNASLISTIGIVLLGLSLIGLAKLGVSTKFIDMFSANSQTNSDMAWIEQHLGPIASIEVLLRFSPNSDFDLLDRARCVRRVMEHLGARAEVGGVFSATTFLPAWSESGSLGAAARRGALRQSLETHISELVQRRMVAETAAGQIWRITAKVSAVTDDDYGLLSRRIAAATREVTDSIAPSHGLDVEFTGLTPMMHATQITILQDLGYSFATAFLLITPVLMFISGGFFSGLLIMIPNVLPVTIVFGAMGWFGFTLDIAGILTSSVALGIAVDDTLHFVSWYMRELKKGRSRESAVANSLQSCAAAMMYTTAISCCSMAPFLLANFLPTRQFAILMIAMLSGAILGDLILLPALLLSPVGKRWFAPAPQPISNE